MEPTLSRTSFLARVATSLSGARRGPGVLLHRNSRPQDIVARNEVSEQGRLGGNFCEAHTSTHSEQESSASELILSSNYNVGSEGGLAYLSSVLLHPIFARGRHDDQKSVELTSFTTLTSKFYPH